MNNTNKNPPAKRNNYNPRGGKTDPSAGRRPQQQSRPGARQMAFDSLCRCEEDGRYTSLELDSLIRRAAPERKERALYTALLYGVIERRLSLDFLIEKYSGKKIAKLDLPVLSALRLGLYQILCLDRVPDSAACNESVALVKKKAKSAASFVNAILRRACRDRDDGSLPFPKADDETTLSPAELEALYSFPRELIISWQRDYGKVRALSILRALSQGAPLSLRTNTLKISREELIERIKRAGGDDIDVCPSFTSAGVTVRAGGAVSELDALRDGLCFVQDGASQTAVEALSPHPGAFVIDVCAAPGGKSFSAAMLMEGRGRIISRDLHENKLSLISSGAARLGISIIETQARDSSIPDAENEGKADYVICDAPCSGYGVCAKKPELRYRPLSEADGLPEIQRAILEASARLVKPGGVVMYSTCTLRKAENEAVTASFAAAHPEFRPLDGDGVTVFPVADDGGDAAQARDGFFYARFRKI